MASEGAGGAQQVLVGVRAVAAEAGDVREGEVNRQRLHGTETQAGRQPQLIHARGLGVQEIILYRGFVEVGAQTDIQSSRSGELGSQAVDAGILIVFRGTDIVAAQLRVGAELHVQRFIGAPANELHLGREIPTPGGFVIDAHVPVVRQWKLGREGRLVQRWQLEAGHDHAHEAHQFIHIRLIGVGKRYVALFHPGGHFRAVRDTDGHFLGDVEHRSHIETEPHTRVAPQTDGGGRHVVILTDQRLHLVGDHRAQSGASGQHLVCHIADVTGADQGTVQLDIPELHHQAGPDAEAVHDLPGYRRLDVERFQRDILHQVGAFPVASPVDGAAVRGVQAHARRQVIINLETGVYVHRRARLVIRLRRIIAPRELRVREYAGDSRRQIYILIHKNQSGRIEVHALRAQLHGGAHVPHTGLFRALRVHLVALGRRVR